MIGAGASRRSLWSAPGRAPTASPLGQVATEEKSGAIKAIPELLKLLEIKGCIVTIGAMGCQKAITEQLLAQGADYLLAGEVTAVAQAAPAHRGVGNPLHWVLDVPFREDDSRIGCDHAPANFNTLRQFALNRVNHKPLRSERLGWRGARSGQEVGFLGCEAGCFR